MKSKLFALIVFLSSHCLFSGGIQEEEIKENEEALEELFGKKRDRGLLFLSDETEIEFNGVISKALFFAIEQKAGPILVSGCLFNSFLQTSKDVDTRYATGALKDNPFAELVTKASHALQHEKDNSRLPKIMNEVLSEGGLATKIASAIVEKAYPEVWQAILLNRSINFEDWLVFEVDASRLLYLLIPYDYIWRLAPELLRDKSYVVKNIAKISWLLGFKLYNMNMISNKELPNLTKKACNPGLYDASLLTLLDNIFITQQEYFQNKKAETSPIWTLYLTGHGTPRATVAGIALREFSKMLDFFEKSIITKLFVYDSCFAAGQNAEEIYRDLLREGSKKLYQYPLVTAALTDASTSVSFPNFFDRNGQLLVKDRKLFPAYDLDFADFMNRALTTQTPLDFAYIVAPVIPLAESSKLYGSAKTAAQIRLPGMPWFSVIDAQNRVVSISTLLAAAYEGKSLDILKFFTQQMELAPQSLSKKMKEKKAAVAPSSRKPSARHRSDLEPEPFAILLYTTHIPLMIDIHEMMTVPQFVSLVPGRAIHYIQSIDARFTSLQTLSEHFENSPHVYKVFLIDAIKVSSLGLSAAKNIRPEMQRPFTARNVLMRDGEVYFEFENQVLKLYGEGFKEFSLPTVFETLEYYAMVAIYRSEIAQKYGQKQPGSMTSLTPQILSSFAGKLKKLQEKHPERIAQRAKELHEEERKEKSDHKSVGNGSPAKDLVSLESQLQSLLYALS